MVWTHWQGQHTPEYLGLKGEEAPSAVSTHMGLKCLTPKGWGSRITSPIAGYRLFARFSHFSVQVIEGTTSQWFCPASLHISVFLIHNWWHSTAAYINGLSRPQEFPCKLPVCVAGLNSCYWIRWKCLNNRRTDVTWHETNSANACKNQKCCILI